jgi:hypothetical protein
MAEEQYCEVFDWIRQYAVREGWIPIGWRDFHVGPWRIRVNGTPEDRDGIPPYHALIDHDTIVALMLVNPFGGSVGGWQGAEAEFCAALQQALEGISSDDVRRT